MISGAIAREEGETVLGKNLAAVCLCCKSAFFGLKEFLMQDFKSLGMCVR